MAIYDRHNTRNEACVNSSIECPTKTPSNRKQLITIIHAGSKGG